ncbi:MAG: hypothetical protein IT563_19415 [Alphaproteobacteria bacterium]|nr:hypothetical protein [Alphaproteobacteria bacterium]
MMAWNFRGSLAHIEFQRDTRVLLPFQGCAWLSDAFEDGGPEQVFDTRLELLRQDDVMIEAIRDEAASIAQRCGVLASNAMGCLYRLGGGLHVVAGVSPETMAMIRSSLLAPLAEGRLHLTAKIDFPGFAVEDPIRRLSSSRPAGVTRKAFDAGQSAIHFDAFNLNIGFNAWASSPMRAGQPYLYAAANDEQPRL